MGDEPRVKFVPDRRPLRGRGGNRPPTPAIVVIVVITTLAWLPFAIERWSPGAVAAHIPYAKHDLFWIGLLFFPMIALLVVAGVTKLVEFHAAKGWVTTTGRILNAGIDVRHHQFAGEPETVTNVPALRYEFQAGARTVIGSRIGIGDDALADPEATLKRYPVGATVTVYYDAADPTQCVLERGGLQGIGKGELLGGCASGLAILAVFGGVIYGLFAYGPGFIATHFPKAAPNPTPAILSFCFGLGALMMFFAARRYAKQAVRWPSVRGRIVESRVESFSEYRDGHRSVFYRPVVEYAYAVHGLELHGNQIKLMTQLAGSESMAQRMAAKYPVDSAVDVHYDPADPTTSALENPTGAAWIAAVVALVFFAASAWLLGIFG
jgi:Protein of unknown function (DUF3592)